MRLLQYVFAVSFSLVGLCDPSFANPVDMPLASPAIDESLFKEGVVENRETKFEAWYAKCQQIVKIQKRVCNLLSSVADKDGQTVGSVLVATDDKGTPAMMISLSTAVLPDKPLVIKTKFAAKTGKKSKDVNYKKSVLAVQCETGCKFVFPLDTKVVFSLNAGNDVELTALVPPTPDAKKPKKPVVTSLVISGRGFADALEASSAAW